MKDRAFLDTNILIYGYSVTEPETIRSACKIANKYQYSFYDSLIISAVLEADCTILYSEDLHHNQLIEKKFRIINPFK
ncbi:MAG: hypothetical protein K8S16_02310 [Bacteroidales bacterium]|nr:hypothetical protein [Bacteroidales bacterium]